VKGACSHAFPTPRSTDVRLRGARPREARGSKTLRPPCRRRPSTQVGSRNSARARLLHFMFNPRRLLFEFRCRDRRPTNGDRGRAATSLALGAARGMCIGAGRPSGGVARRLLPVNGDTGTCARETGCIPQVCGCSVRGNGSSIQEGRCRLGRGARLGARFLPSKKREMQRGRASLRSRRVVRLGEFRGRSSVEENQHFVWSPFETVRPAYGFGGKPGQALALISSPLCHASWPCRNSS